ncbi:hypothetical protein D3C81_785310 [compost metagenome]
MDRRRIVDVLDRPRDDRAVLRHRVHPLIVQLKPRDQTVSAHQIPNGYDFPILAKLDDISNLEIFRQETLDVIAGITVVLRHQYVTFLWDVKSCGPGPYRRLAIDGRIDHLQDPIVGINLDRDIRLGNHEGGTVISRK